MQKKLLTMAVAGALAMPAVALAQVTVFGTIDTGLRNQSKVQTTATTDDSVLKVTDGLRTTNRWGLRGSEDLGAGLMANFWLEGQYSSDTGQAPASSTSTTTAAPVTVTTTTGLFQRKAVVGLSKGGNSVDLGRDYTVNFKMQGIFDPMSYTYTGVTPTAGSTFTAGTRSDNLVTAGFRFGTGGIRVDYAVGEVVGDNGRNTRTGIGADFAFGPVTVAGAFSTQETSATADTTTTNIGAVYRMGAFTFRGGMSTAEVDSGNEHQLIMLGAQYAFSPTLNGRVGYYSWTVDSSTGTEVATRKTAMVALDYILSKRTTLYVAFDRTAADGTGTTGLSTSSGTFVAGPGTAVDGSKVNDGSTGISAGIAHSF